ncbi:MAG TPA: hypothetical protein PKG82_03885 [Myxococcota bacterium]|mgnify:FL=1|nr:hypothetical protein [Myxococcota bacterium]
MTSLSRLTAGLCFIFLAATGCSSQVGQNPVRTLKASAGDGASASIDVDSSLGEASVTFTRTSDADGSVTGDRMNVSGTYLLNFSGSATGDAVLTIPLAASLLPDEFSPASLTVERQDPLTGDWVPAASLTDYDVKSREISLVVPLEPESRSSTARSASMVSCALTVAEASYRVGLALWTNSMEARIPGSAFVITYYPHAAGSDWTVPDDASWKSSSGRATDPATPDYIEDLDAALNDAYAKLLAVSDGTDAIFSPLTDDQRHVFVESCGESAGLSPMGGPMKISASQIKSFNDMKGVAGHELVHVFQGQYFLTGKTGRLAHLVAGVGSWLWFIEGSANYFSARAQSLSGAARDTLYGRNEDGKYMSLGLSAGNDQSYYMTAHFLDFIADRAGIGVVPAVLRAGSGSNSTAALSRALLDSPRGDGIGTILEAYAQALVKTPETGSGLHLHLVANLLNHQMDAELGYLSGTSFSNSTTFLTLKRLLPPLSLAYAEARDTTATDSLLVVEALPTNPSSVATFTWDRLGTTDAVFADALPLEDYSGRTLTVKNFGAGQVKSGFSQIIVNNDLSRHHEIDFKYYILIPLPVIGQDDGSATVDTSQLGNIPADYIKELRLLRMTDAGTYELLTKFSPAGGQTVVSNRAILKDDLLEVQTVDRHGNEWPEFDMGEAVTVYVGCHDFVDGADVWGCEKLDWVGQDTESTAFIDAATVKCLNNNYRQYYAMAFDEIDMCRDWCDDRASGGGTCLTPGEGGEGLCGSIEPGNDFCLDGECWNCCADCEEPAIYLFSCMYGCQTGVIELHGIKTVVCECN